MSDLYVKACEDAATNQGLDPLTTVARARTAELESAGVVYGIEQTGGFCMVACFYIGEEEVVTVTNEGTWMVLVQSWGSWTEGNGDVNEELASYPLEDPGAIVDAVIERASTS